MKMKIIMITLSVNQIVINIMCNNALRIVYKQTRNIFLIFRQFFEEFLSNCKIDFVKGYKCLIPTYLPTMF